MTTDHVVALEAGPNQPDLHVLMKGLVAFNTAQVGGETQQYIVATVRDDADAVVGGILAVSYIGWLHVQAVWLHESLRAKG